MATTFYDPFTRDGSAYDGVLTPAVKDNPWAGYTYKDSAGETWTIQALVTDKDDKLSALPFGIISVITNLKDKPDKWRATLPANQDTNPPHQSIALYSDTLVSTLEDIDHATTDLIKNTSGGSWLWLVLLGLGFYAFSKKGRRR